MTVTDFLLARIAEDEAAAKLTLAPKILPGEASSVVRGLDGGIAGIYVDPARVLAQCAAMRQIVDRAERLGPDISEFEGILQMLASIWSDHPDYREEWRA